MCKLDRFACRDCPAFYEVKADNIVGSAGGWERKLIDGESVLCCRPAPVLGAKRRLQRFCYYCTARVPRGRMIGHKASWTGGVPVWCPRRRKEGASGAE